MVHATSHQVLDLQPDLSLTVSRTGAGPGILVLHGGGGPGSVSAVVDHYADRHHVLAPVHPGWAGAARPARLDSVAALAMTYLDLLARLDLTDVAVIGSSFGGWVAAEMAIHQIGHRVSSVVLLDAAGPQLQPHHTPAAARTSDPADAARAGRTPSPAELGWMHAYTGPAMQDPGLLARLTGTDIPALVVWGEDDPVLPVTFGRDYADAFPRGEFQLIPRAGHLPFLDQPGATFAAVDRFLQTASGPQTATSARVIS
jgi:pimeloyl-ACP methyl ester carboxylesterase